MKKILKFILYKIQYYLLTAINYIVPKDKSSVFIFDKKFKKDNVWSIALYLSNNDMGRGYKIYYYADKANIDKPYKNIIFLKRSTLALWKQIRSKYVFYSYRGDGYISFKSTKTQMIIDTMHGSPLKNIGYTASKSKFNRLWRYENTFDHIICLSDFFKEVIMESFGACKEQCLVLGYPRNDIIFDNKNTLYKLDILREHYEKILLWMPTWKKSNNSNESDTDFPILTDENINNFNNYLKENNILLIIKPHPFQLELELFNKINSNIKIIKNKDLEEKDIFLYELFSGVDALLTDYSSVYFDFLLTMKPIGFTIDDFDSYEDKRGFVVDNPLDIMPGEKIITLKCLINFIEDIKNGNDKYYEERKKVNDLVNKYKDGDSTKRLVEFLGM